MLGALNCNIEPVTDQNEYQQLVDNMQKDCEEKSNGTKPIKGPKVHQIWRVTKELEKKGYSGKAGNEVTLFHGSPTPNFVGILSHGLMLPQDVSKNGGKCLAACLGQGIYFGYANSGQGYA